MDYQQIRAAILKFALTVVGAAALLVAAIALLAVLGIYLYSKAGQQQGEEISVNMDAIQVEQYIPFPGGRFAVTHMYDSLPPVLIKLDKKNNVVWAVKMNVEVGGTPLTEISKMNLVDTPYRKELIFFNESYSEPGYVALDSDYDIDYIYLSPM